MSLDITPYLAVTEAWDYFDTRLDSSDWECADDEHRLKALKTATRLINRLKFRGVKFDLEQVNEFPRDDNALVPDDVKIATCEIASVLLSAVDLELEMENLFTKSQSYASINTGYDGSIVPDYLRAGIPSAVAWSYLRPYLFNPRTIRVNRIGDSNVCESL